MAKVVILGAGLTGISAAYHFEKLGFTDFAIFEKEKRAGGLCRSVTQDGFTFDFTGHLLHTSDAYFRSLISSVVGLENMNTIQRRSFIYSHETYTRFPFQVNLYGLPTDVIAECIEGYVTRPHTRKKPRSFNEWAHQSFGKGLAKHFFTPYQRKIFAYNLNDITASWTGRFVPKTSLKEMISGALQDNTEKSFGYNASFLYPKQGGIEFWIKKLADKVHTPIHTEYIAHKIDLKRKVVYFENGHEEPFDTLINTIPLDTCIRMLKEKPSTRFNHALDKLKCNSVVNFNLGFSRPDVSNKHWIYFPEKEYPFYRMGFPHNFSEQLAPEGCSSLYGEFAHVGKSRPQVQRMLTQALDMTKKLLNVSNNDIATEKIIHISHAYVIYNFWREQYLPRLLDQLASQGIHSVGRYGAWKYSSMQEAVLDGKQIAETLAIKPATIDRQPLLQKSHAEKEL